MSILIKNGTLVNPCGLSGDYDIVTEGASIAQIAPRGLQGEFDTIIDAQGKTVCPGFVDMHVHLREPGFEYKEDIQSGTRAAVAGGFTGVACMPNTAPVNDDISVLAFINDTARKKGACKVYPICAITKGLAGKELTEMGMLLEGGAVGFTDDGKPVSDPNRMSLALQYSKNFDALILSHCEDLALADGGVMNEGYYSTILGLAPSNPIAEAVMVARDVLLAQFYGARLHICHVSCAQSVQILRNAKAQGVRVTCETAPHYFSLDDSYLQGYDTNYKMNPPLRTLADVEAIKQGLADGTIDAIATDHAPHCLDEKRIEFQAALNGIVGLETSFSLAYTHLVKTGVLTMDALIDRMSVRPCKILGVEGGVLAPGKAADITIVDCEKNVVYTEQNLHSKSKNSPFLGVALQGEVVHTIVDGVIR